MITRIWHGRTKTSDAVVYRKYTESIGVKELMATKGNLGVQIWQKEEGEITHIWVVSLWNSLEEIKEFSGEDIRKARYYEADTDYLLEKEPQVQHYQCYDYRK